MNGSGIDENTLLPCASSEVRWALGVHPSLSCRDQCREVLAYPENASEDVLGCRHLQYGCVARIRSLHLDSPECR